MLRHLGSRLKWKKSRNRPNETGSKSRARTDKRKKLVEAVSKKKDKKCRAKRGGKTAPSSARVLTGDMDRRRVFSAREEEVKRNKEHLKKEKRTTEKHESEIVWGDGGAKGVTRTPLGAS